MANKKPSEIWNSLTYEEKIEFLKSKNLETKYGAMSHGKWEDLEEEVKQEFVAYNMTEESKLQKAAKGKFVITSKSQPGELFIGHSIGGKQIQWVEEWRKPITFSSESKANKFLEEIEMDGIVINKEESKLQKAAKPKESKLSKALKTAKAKTIEGYVKAEEKVKEAIAEKKSEMEKYIKINDLKKFAILEFTKNGKMFKLEKAVRGFNIEDRPGNKSKVIIYHYTPELEEFLVSNKIKATVFDSKEELNEWLTGKL